MSTADIKSFNYLENGSIEYSILDSIKSTKKLDAGSYKLKYHQSYPTGKLEFTVLPLDEIHDPIQFHFIPKMEIVFERFFQPKIKKKINELGYAHKLGIMLHGKQGGSKSSIFNYYAKKFIKEKNAIYFYIEGSYAEEAWAFIQKIRKIQNNPIIVFFDEFDKFFPHSENDIKPMLDGNLSIDNTICFFATNYFDKIPDTVKDRPSRIKYKYEVESLDNAEAIEKILVKAIGDLLSEDEMSEAIEENMGNTIDEIKDYIQDKIMDLTFEKVGKKNIGFRK